MQGKAVMQCDGDEYPITVGDVFIVERGEDRHLVADTEGPCINLWLLAGTERSREQLPDRG